MELGEKKMTKMVPQFHGPVNVLNSECCIFNVLNSEYCIFNVLNSEYCIF